tara:strand:+ start:1306 stop:1488 length:183 start_codon:yes stop_codon:yes gene_type:complete
MPDYIAVIKSVDNKKKKVKILSSCIRDAEEEAESILKKGEVLVSVTNDTFPIGHIKTVSR